MHYRNVGTSDPYVKFKLGNKVIHRSKTVYRDLNPIWEEDFYAHVDDLNTPLHIRVIKSMNWSSKITIVVLPWLPKVFDYDWGLQDDFLGAATFDLNQLELNK